MPIKHVMKNPALLTICLMICLGVMQVYSQLRYHFSGIDGLHKEITHLSQKLEEQKLQTLVAQERAEDLRQSVAAVLSPELLERVPDHQKKYQLRSIASVTQTGHLQRLKSPSEVLSQGKELFKKQEFVESSKVFESIAEIFPASPAAPEALFLAVESQYQLQRHSPMIKIVEIMMARYPESDLTGFALLRLAELYVQEGRPTDSLEVIETVLENFSNPQLLKQASEHKKRL